MVQTGGCEKWHTEEFSDNADIPPIDTNSLGFYHLEGNTYKLDKTEPLASMGDEKTLENFVSWSTENYPADRYMLILWDHDGRTVMRALFRSS